MVEGNAGFDPAVLVENVGVESRVHALSRATGAKGAATAEKCLERGESVDVGGGDGEDFEGEVDVGEMGEGGIGGRGEVRKGKKAAGVVRGGC